MGNITKIFSGAQQAVTQSAGRINTVPAADVARVVEAYNAQAAPAQAIVAADWRRFEEIQRQYAEGRLARVLSKGGAR